MSITRARTGLPVIRLQFYYTCCQGIITTVLDFRPLFAKTDKRRYPGMALTRRQKEVMDFLSGFIQKYGYSPSYDEIATGLKLASLATVHKHIQALEAKQYLRRSYNHSRSLEI